MYMSAYIHYVSLCHVYKSTTGDGALRPMQAARQPSGLGGAARRRVRVCERPRRGSSTERVRGRTWRALARA